MDSIDERATERKARKARKKAFNKQCWGSARYMAYDDTLTVDPKGIYKGSIQLGDFQEALGLAAHFCTKLDCYFTAEQLMDMFRALGELYNRPAQEVIGEAKAARPWCKDCIQKVEEKAS